jgi:hypothetical protein
VGASRVEPVHYKHSIVHSSSALLIKVCCRILVLLLALGELQTRFDREVTQSTSINSFAVCSARAGHSSRMQQQAVMKATAAADRMSR